MRTRGILIVCLILIGHPFVLGSLAADYKQIIASQMSTEFAERDIRTELDKIFGPEGFISDKAKEEGARRLGFGSLRQLRDAKVGVPFSFVSVRLNDLREYQSESDPGKLLKETTQTIFPLLAREKEDAEEAIVKSFAIVERLDIGKSADPNFLINFASPKIYHLLTDYRKAFPKENENNQKCLCFIGWIQGIERYFLGDETSGELKVRVFGWGPKKGEGSDLRPAKQVFAELSQEAKRPIYEFPPIATTQEDWLKSHQP